MGRRGEVAKKAVKKAVKKAAKKPRRSRESGRAAHVCIKT
jgi:hypothetical protein